MGERGKNDEMKNRTTSLNPIEPDAEKPEDATSMTSTNSTAPPRKTDVRLGREVQARIGQQLRAMYNDVVNQGVPDHLTDLVRRLGDLEQK
jgi:hypothetical protein